MTECKCDEETPLVLDIAAGQNALPRQLRAFPEVREALLRAIPSQPALAGWDARGERDLGLMWLEMWAYVTDVLGFYDERIANESYLRTAQRRVSLRRLIELLGYVQTPGSAGTATLAALADGRKLVNLPVGTGFRSDAFGKEAPHRPLDATTPKGPRRRMTSPCESLRVGATAAVVPNVGSLSARTHWQRKWITRWRVAVLEVDKTHRRQAIAALGNAHFANAVAICIAVREGIPGVTGVKRSLTFPCDAPRLLVSTTVATLTAVLGIVHNVPACSTTTACSAASAPAATRRARATPSRRISSAGCPTSTGRRIACSRSPITRCVRTTSAARSGHPASRARSRGTAASRTAGAPTVDHAGVGNAFEPSVARLIAVAGTGLSALRALGAPRVSAPAAARQRQTQHNDHPTEFANPRQHLGRGSFPRANAPRKRAVEEAA